MADGSQWANRGCARGAKVTRDNGRKSWYFCWYKYFSRTFVTSISMAYTSNAMTARAPPVLFFSCSCNSLEAPARLWSHIETGTEAPQRCPKSLLCGATSTFGPALKTVALAVRLSISGSKVRALVRPLSKPLTLVMTDIGDEMEMATQSAQARLKRADPKRTRPDRVRGLPSCPRPSAAPPTIGAFFMMTKPASSRC